MKDPATVAAKWNRNLKNSTESIRQGVAAVKTAPGEKAAKAQEKMLANLTAAVESGKWARKVSAVSLADWQKSMELGISRISGGADAAQPKMEGFMKEFLPHVEAGKQKIENMPNVTLDDGINRMIAMVRHNAEFSRK